MARIRSITVGTDGSVVHPTEVDCEIKRIVPTDRAVLLQLSTFGSPNRVSEPKVSQTIQLDRETAFTLRNLIDKTFDF